MNFIKKYLTSNQLTKNERLVAEYIIENPNEFLNSTTREIAKKIYVSPAIITRFARKIGMASFHELQMRIVKELTVETEDSISDEIPVKETDTSYQLMNKIEKML
ncbi:hypothetical protein GIX45_09690 [Erwinia sp. CPCC 100877]|nr:hypothetical protein [Erwinia sp. CPCC 100877]